MSFLYRLPVSQTVEVLSKWCSVEDIHKIIVAVSDPISKNHILSLFSLPGFVFADWIYPCDVAFTVQHCKMKIERMCFPTEIWTPEKMRRNICVWSPTQALRITISDQIFTTLHSNSVKYLTELMFTAKLLCLECSVLANSCTALKKLVINDSYEYGSQVDEFLLKCLEPALNCMEKLDFGGRSTQVEVMSWIQDKCRNLQSINFNAHKIESPLENTIACLTNNRSLTKISLRLGHCRWSSDHICEAIAKVHSQTISTLYLARCAPFTLPCVLTMFEKCKKLTEVAIGPDEPVSLRVTCTFSCADCRKEQASGRFRTTRCAECLAFDVRVEHAVSEQEVDRIFDAFPTLAELSIENMSEQLIDYTRAKYPHIVLWHWFYEHRMYVSWR